MTDHKNDDPSRQSSISKEVDRQDKKVNPDDCSKTKKKPRAVLSMFSNSTLVDQEKDD